MKAAAAGQWGVVESLSRELGARRQAHADPKVVALDPTRRRGGKSD
jgi:hypothetical protein